MKKKKRLSYKTKTFICKKILLVIISERCLSELLCDRSTWEDLLCADDTGYFVCLFLVIFAVTLNLLLPQGFMVETCSRLPSVSYRKRSLAVQPRVHHFNYGVIVTIRIGYLGLCYKGRGNKVSVDEFRI